MDTLNPQSSNRPREDKQLTSPHFTTAFADGTIIATLARRSADESSEAQGSTANYLKFLRETMLQRTNRLIIDMSACENPSTEVQVELVKLSGARPGRVAAVINPERIELLTRSPFNNNVLQAFTAVDDALKYVRGQQERTPDLALTRQIVNTIDAKQSTASYPYSLDALFLPRSEGDFLTIPAEMRATDYVSGPVEVIGIGQTQRLIITSPILTAENNQDLKVIGLLEDHVINIRASDDPVERIVVDMSGVLDASKRFFDALNDAELHLSANNIELVVLDTRGVLKNLIVRNSGDFGLPIFLNLDDALKQRED